MPVLTRGLNDKNEEAVPAAAIFSLGLAFGSAGEAHVLPDRGQHVQARRGPCRGRE